MNHGFSNIALQGARLIHNNAGNPGM